MRRLLAVSASAIALALTLTACAGSPSTTAEPIEISTDTVVLDVRTPDEYAGGHLEGSTLLDFNSGELAAAIPNLDPDAEYLVYCRSGNRAGQAIALMEQAGFTTLTNLGSLQQAADATGLPIVK
ncbi:rhodanese-like domain-containing protein [Microbacterium esteraromaticum]|uniref:Rhodanese-like domain-containing protein n=1 Tax=Microbacterium esteraromaticum TaxID=57043 RepID=A0A939DWH6_9MICO|nr:rhodanese-like domain-containing protein [Microbacterium esteraromaticum]MBN7792543.1 rhodanese-like domain-containing protein [Microbacterium esteraromaticum]MBN8206190.1 rhodanese-like domain-containing protein [Microbacterium esteraromaticum]MBN8416345.1 rhodanese-like domain-containing protein [Microbacterium esteraromaticum]MBN8423300.1 rhodanese-like domain-containing protein [Microbacterium esteraromaticum]MBY6061201.1 rhodanese-like domain-containing protein [Microbacterium esteraro